jgi:hypothetical protein
MAGSAAGRGLTVQDGFARYARFMAVDDDIAAGTMATPGRRARRDCCSAVTARRRRSPGPGRPATQVLVGSTLIALALAGCGSDGAAKPAPSPSSTAGSFGLRLGDAPYVLTQCGLTAGHIKPQPGQPWYADGKVLVLTGPGSGSHAGELATWWDAHKSTVIGGHALSYWQSWAAQHDSLPRAVCGQQVSARTLQARLAPGDNNPWGS